ncbi:hypothetical protein TEA_020002 [Camellia sinensis var. sinensis]|uniref:MULE transposase domain-containing protein n=1 Tax=Camellia sinensis var. sinensis TaxID=542762 RepID=A0A4S4EXK3_CAMSN|nr:hypothetical protein TEA_020002 [Camellia sinensis var. sinensis]
MPPFIPRQQLMPCQPLCHVNNLLTTSFQYLAPTGIKRLKYPLCTLLVFDSRQHALPIAWVIIRNIAKPDMSKWMKALLDCAHAIDPGWKINGFLIDDATEEINLTRHDDLTQYFLFKFIYNANAAHSHSDFSSRDTFSRPILFSLWRVQRS